MAKYSKVKSEYIKSLIRKTSWKNKEKIDNLIFLEDVIREKKKLNFGGGMLFNRLKNKYEKEYKTIYEELDLKGYKKSLNEEEERKKKARDFIRKFDEDEKKKLEKEKEDWIKNGGKR